MTSLIGKLGEFFKKSLTRENLPKGVIIIGTSLLIMIMIKGIKKVLDKNYWRKLAKEVREERDKKITAFLEKHKDLLTEEKIKMIIEADASTLLGMIHEKKVTSVEALVTYAQRAGTIGKELELICDVDFEEAYNQAIKADEIIQKTPKEEIEKLYPLLGLPFSVKDQAAVKGMINTAGYTALHKNIPKEDSLMIHIMRKKGAIPFIHTNIPQGYFSFESSNFLWGNALNPWDRTRTPGGSSGGCAGLVASRCSPFSIGSDIGGSIRVPSSFTGLYGLKPTSFRISKKGGLSLNSTYSNGFQAVNSAWGPLCRSAQDVFLVTKNLFGSFEEDTYINNKPFDNELFNITKTQEKIKIAYFSTIKNLIAAESMINAVSDVINKLKEKSPEKYEFVEFPADRFVDLIETGMVLLSNSDAFPLIVKSLSGEEIASYYKNLMAIHYNPTWFLKIVAKVFHLLGERRKAHFINQAKKLNRSEYIETTRKFLILRSEYITYIQENKIDAVICPITPVPAYSFGISHEVFAFAYYSFLFNMIDCPGVCVPLYLNQDEHENLEYDPKGQHDKDKFYKIFLKEAKTSKGLPICVQICALPMKDEICLALMNEVDEIYRFDKKYGGKVLEVMKNS